MDDRQFQKLLDQLDLSWKGYRKVRKGVKKRIARHMQAVGCRTPEAYLRELADNPAALKQCGLLMTVSISRFFRDRNLWRILREEGVPELIRRFPEKLDVWSAGCASGEELHSFRILWEELSRTRGKLPALSLLGTDMNPDYLDRCRAGVYPRSNLREVPEELRLRYFDVRRGGRRCHLKPDLKEGIVWRRHDLFDAPPGPLFHIIFLRNNLLTYYLPHRQREAFAKIVATLAPCGILAIGSHECLPFTPERLIPHDSCPYLFRMRAG
ncbi:chemotaxis protein CheR [Desulfonema ishimotonii]|uniref:Chemotaxis protein CheR n=1 Tax=Desulfonema ishimotonii TaxID=45657 RepID=A0A401FVJ8_9BACT|nr:CheR family methyltransferase [Desulfonema ishimotonii]GBC61002.1 chemotaxis protein CheR [Desulfonema ishimotonii]